MKRKGFRFFVVAALVILAGLFIPAINFLFNPFGGSFYYSLFIGGSLIWLGIFALDTRTPLNIVNCKRLHPYVIFSGETATITVSRSAAFIKYSAALFLFISLGLAPWLYPGVFLSGGTAFVFAVCVSALRRLPFLSGYGYTEDCC